jgi:hypothetical protein
MLSALVEIYILLAAFLFLGQEISIFYQNNFYHSCVISCMQTDVWIQQSKYELLHAAKYVQSLLYRNKGFMLPCSVVTAELLSTGFNG